MSIFSIDPFTLLSPEYETTYEQMYGRQPKFIPIGFRNNSDSVIEPKRAFSRTWTKNPKYKKKDS